MSTLATDVQSGDGSTTVFTLAFEFLSRDDVTVSRLASTDPDTAKGTALAVIETGTPTGDQYIWNSDTQIQLGTAPTSDQKVKFQRVTPIDSQVVEWNDGSFLISEDLNDDSLQALYLIQELQDQVDALDGHDDGAAVKEVFATAPVQVDNTDQQKPIISVDAITKAEAEADPTNPAWDDDTKLGSAGAIDCIYKQVVGAGSSYAGKRKLGQLRIDNSGAEPKLFYWDANAATPAWVEIQVGSGGDGLPDAPDSKPYVRSKGAWREGVLESNKDGKIYGRKDGSWAEVSASGGGIVYKGTRDLTQPAPSAAVGDFYVNTATSGTIDNSWTGLGGQALTGAERVVYDGSTWEMLPAPPPPIDVVTSVNGKSGPTVVLDAADVGALPDDTSLNFVPLGSWASIPQLP